MKRHLAGIGLSTFGLLLPAAACLSSSSTPASTGDAGTGTGTGTGSTTSTGTGTGTTPPTGDSSTPPPSGDGGGAGTVLLTATSTGYVDMNTVDVVGAWYGYGDCWGPAGPPGNCQMAGFTTSQCSTISFPPAPMPLDAALPDGAVPTGFPQTTPGVFCLSGTAAMVIDKAGTTTPDYSDIFGIGIGLDFNNVGGVKSKYNTTAHNVVGVTFTITGVPTGGLRVEFPTTETAAGIQDSWAYSITTTPTAPVKILFATDLVESFTPTPPATEPPFDPTALLSIQFHVPTTTTAPVTVTNMCISNLAVITD